ncbi:MAG: T9SS type A sorting domain-containing protein [Saprospiraceae bacterium]
MMKTNFTRNTRLLKLFNLIIMGMICIHQIEAQAPSCACKGTAINVTLGGNGTVTITPADVLTAINSCGDNGAGTVVVMATPTGPPIAGSPVITCDHIGKTLYAKYTNQAGTNSCWTTIYPIEDKIRPTIQCQANMTISCVDMAAYVPIVNDNCPIGLKYNQVGGDIVVNNNCSGLFASNVIKRITRTYIAIDGSGNKSDPCTIQFDVTIIPSLAAITIPAHWDIAVGNNPPLQCNGPWPKLANGNPNPVGTVANPGTGTPKLGAVDLFNNQDLYCGLMISYSDTKVQIGCVSKVMRSWNILEWSCLNRTIAPQLQLLEIVDDKGPIITHAADINASTSNHKCEGVITLPAPIAFDSCSTALTSTITVYANGDYNTPAAFVANAAPRTVTLPVGNHKGVYAVYDACLNVSRDTINITVEDNTPPVAICDEQTTIGLNSNGEAWVPASVIDDGSFDECQLAKLVVRRMTHTSCSSCEVSEFPGFKLLGEAGTGALKRWYYISQHKSTRKIAAKTAAALGGALVVYSGTPAQMTAEQTAVRALAEAYLANVNYHIGNNQKDSSSVAVHTVQPSTATDTLRYIIEVDDLCNTFSTHARFCCTDVASDPRQVVILRAIDASGNFNDCMVTVEVQDKIGPSITCPADRTVTCDFAYDINNLAKDFGSPTVYDNCAPYPTPVETVTNNLTGCRIGNIKRKFVVVDRGGKKDSCTQTITFLPNPNKIYTGPANNQWPASPYMVIGCGSPSDVNPDVTGRPTITQGACSLVAAQYVDQEFFFNNASSPACFKILRTWTVIDWCKFAPNRDLSNTLYPSSKTEGVNTWTWVQEIKVIDNVAPVIDNLAPVVTADTYDATCAKGNISLSARATDLCTAILRYSYKIDTLNDGSFGIVVSGNGNSITVNASFPVGTHKIVYTFEDKCGNLSSKEQLFKIVNKKAPSAVVLQGLAMSLMKISEGVGMADVWAKDFDPDRKSSHPCGYTIYYSFTQVTELVNGLPKLTPNKVFNCADIGKDSVTIWVVAVTPAGDIVQSSVNTYIEIQDNAIPKICPPIGGRVAVTGTLSTESNQTVKDVRVSLVGSEFNSVTGDNGKFEFMNMLSGGKYEVTPEKNDDHINGISTLDLVMIQRHILGIDKLNSPYKLIAADVTKDGKITAADLVELRKLILGTTNTFANNKSWRFVDKAYRFADPTSAQGEAFPEIYFINKLTANMTTDFIAVKTGDVNGNVKANNVENNVETRSSNNLVLNTENQNFVSGQKVVIPVKVAKTSEINGLQFTIAFDNNALALTAIDPAGINVNDSNFGLSRTGEGLLTFSWNDSKAKNLNTGESMFNITFIAKENGNLADLLKVNSTVTFAEAYTPENEVMKVIFNVENRGNDIRGFDLKQNTPNPFKETTIIGFELPSEMKASITVYDISGKVIRTSNVLGAKGYNTVELNKSELHSGVLYYTLRAGEYNATRKMVVID